MAAGGDSVVRVSQVHYRVRSQSGSGSYDVRKDGLRWVCPCADYQRKSQFCKHCWAVELSLRIRADVDGRERPPAPAEPIRQVPHCPKCGSAQAVRVGVRRCGKGEVQRFQCKACGRKFVVDDGFSRLHVPPRAVVAAFDLWAKKVSYRQVAHHLRDVHGITVGKSTVERWVRRLASRIAAYADRCGPRVGEIWHADETTVNVDGKLRYTWNVMDHETRFWLASTVSEARGVADARRPLRAAREVAGLRPRALVTDGLPAYKDAVWAELHTWKDPTAHLVIPPLRKVPTDSGSGGVHPGNNIVERLQGTQRERTKVLRGFDSGPTAQVLIDGYRGYYDLVRPHQGLGGRTPAEAAGVPIPSAEGQGRLMAVLIAADRLRKRQRHDAVHPAPK